MLMTDVIIMSCLCCLSEGNEVVHHTPRFVRDTSKYWYKPNITREEGKKNDSYVREIQLKQPNLDEG